MIRKLQFTNFYSFKETQVVDFMAKRKQTHDYFCSKNGDQVTKVAGCIGKNATGKTNIIRLISFLKYFICSNSSNKDDTIPFQTFFNNASPSKFEIEIEIDDVIYYYTLKIEENIILKEELNLKNVKKNAKKTLVFSRLKKNFKFNPLYIKGLDKDYLGLIKNNLSFIGYIKSKHDIPIINLIFTYFNDMQTNINEEGDSNNNLQKFLRLNTFFTNNILNKELSRLIKSFDVGIKDIKILSTQEKNILKKSFKVVHAGKEDQDFFLSNFKYESRGTQFLFFILIDILIGLEKNSVILIDELSSVLHPIAIIKLLDYFIHKNKEKNSQIIFTTHSEKFMTRFDPQQIFIVDKSPASESFIYRLSDVKGIRPDENFAAKYLSGAYGSFPKILY